MVLVIFFDVQIYIEVDVSCCTVSMGMWED